MARAKSTKTPCPKHASTKYGRARYVALCKECVALNTTTTSKGDKR